MSDGNALSRRTALRASVGAATAAAAGPAIALGGGSAAARAEPDYGDWFDDVDNFDGTVDERGSDAVTVEVGADANGDAFGFEPAAVRVDPGTTIVWEWTGEGGSHNVVAEDGSFESDLSGEAGFTFERAAESEGVVKYVCAPHEAVGMKGAIVVGDAAGAGSGGGAPDVSGAELVAGGLVAGVLSPLAFGLVLLFRGIGDEPRGRRPPGGGRRRGDGDAARAGR
ncbi:halocyanin domain-containing protein [Halegenticoccus tardaugens]|uniref:halocyanin domain-containing protein n=1 Tax=Halegenticoccus tardaugens TaxID=2071624 RepID=UPI00100A31D2